MPYIKQRDRLYYKATLDRLSQIVIETPGELNYLLTSIANQYLNDNKVSYGTFNNIIGALESAKLEFYRRQIAEYEEKKIEENGDLFLRET
jgi:predicted DNA-binding protein with PD1-like motif